MKAVALALAALWICGGLGRVLLGRLSIWGDAALERFVYSAALGLGIAAYGVLALGLSGFLSFWPITVWWLMLGTIGAFGMRDNGRDVVSWLRPRKSVIPEIRAESWLYRSGLLILCFCGAIAVLACYLPPMGREWDAISYHLADPKVFLQMGRIVSLPTEHHSNFPFTLEMLFTVGLLYDGYPLANLFHCLTGALTALLLLGFGTRRWSPLVGMVAALLYVTTPPVLWQAGVAYIDLALGLYVALATFAAINGLHSRTQNNDQQERNHRDWILLAGIMMGFGLGVKYLALLPFGLLALFLIVRRLPVKQVAIYVGVALVIASPWYVKNVVLTQNPVYPYFFSVFPKSRYWSAERAAAYQSEQSSFGYAGSLKQPREAVLNLIQSPWRLVSDADKYANKGDYTFTTLFGGALAALCFAFLFLKGVPAGIRELYMLGVAQGAAWFFVAQVGRYLLSILPLLAVVGGYTLWRLYQSPPGKPFGALMRWTALCLIFGQALLLFWGVFALPTGGREAMARNVLPTGLSVPEAVADIVRPGAREESLRKRLDVYSASDWINQNTSHEAGVVLYDETRGFYLDRPYLWGNAAHSAYIRYDEMQTGEALSQWLREKGFRYALINLNWSPQRQQDTDMPYGPAGNEEMALQRWYYEGEQKEHFRQLIQDALRKGEWRPVFAQNGVVVLEIQ